MIQKLLPSLSGLFLCSTLSAQPAPAAACDSFTLRITLRNYKSDSLRILYFDCTNATKSVNRALTDGAFVFTGTINRVSEAIVLTDQRVHLDHPRIIRFILEPGEITVNANIEEEQAGDVRIEGSIAQSQKQAWEQEQAALLKMREDVGTQLSILVRKKDPADSVNHKREMKKLEAKRDETLAAILQNVSNYIRSYPDSHLGGYLLNRYHMRMAVDSVKKYYQLQNAVVQKGYFGRAVLDYLFTVSDDDFRAEHDYEQVAETLRDVRTFHDVTLADINGAPVKLDRFKGKPALLYFWGSWCGPCHKQAPVLRKITEEIGTGSMHFISISLNTNPDEWKESMSKRPVPGINLIDTRNLLRHYYQFLAVPRYVIVDSNGRVVNNDAPGAGSGKLKALLEAVIDGR